MVVGAFVFALNLAQDLAVSFDLKFDGVSEQANYELFILFFGVTILSYIIEIGIRYIRYGKLFYWI